MPSINQDSNMIAFTLCALLVLSSQAYNEAAVAYLPSATAVCQPQQQRSSCESVNVFDSGIISFTPVMVSACTPSAPLASQLVPAPSIA